MIESKASNSRAKIEMFLMDNPGTYKAFQLAERFNLSVSQISRIMNKISAVNPRVMRHGYRKAVTWVSWPGRDEDDLHAYAIQETNE